MVKDLQTVIHQSFQTKIENQGFPDDLKHQELLHICGLKE